MIVAVEDVFCFPDVIRYLDRDEVSVKGQVARIQVHYRFETGECDGTAGVNHWRARAIPAAARAARTFSAQVI